MEGTFNGWKYTQTENGFEYEQINKAEKPKTLKKEYIEQPIVKMINKIEQKAQKQMEELLGDYQKDFEKYLDAIISRRNKQGSRNTRK